MTDTSGVTSTPTAPATPVADAPVATPETVDWQAKFNQEVEHRNRERNLYRPVARIIEGLHDDDREAITGLAEAIRTGDRDAIIEWSIGAAEAVSGKSAADLIAERMKGQQPGQATDISSEAQQQATPAMTEEQVRAAMRAAIAEERAAADAAARNQVLIQSYTEKLTAAGLTPASDEGREVIRLTKAFDGDMDQAIKVHRTAKLAEQQAQLGAAQAAAAVGAPAPNGSAPGTAPAADMTPRDRVMSRLAARRT